MLHWLAHLLRINYCEGLLHHDWPYPWVYLHERGNTWKFGVRCLTCGGEKWFD